MKRPVQQRSAASMEQLLKAARRLIRANDFASTSLSQICAEAGLTSGAFYARFRTKDELLLALFEKLEPEISGIIDRFVAAKLQPLDDSVCQLMSEVVDFYEREAPLLRELTAGAWRLPALASAMRRANERNLQRSVESVVARRAASTHPQPALVASLALASTLGTLREFALDRLLFEHEKQVPKRVLVDEMTRMFMAYMES